MGEEDKESKVIFVDSLSSAWPTGDTISNKQTNKNHTTTNVVSQFKTSLEYILKSKSQKWGRRGGTSKTIRTILIYTLLIQYFKQFQNIYMDIKFCNKIVPYILTMKLSHGRRYTQQTIDPILPECVFTSSAIPSAKTSNSRQCL